MEMLGLIAQQRLSRRYAQQASRPRRLPMVRIILMQKRIPARVATYQSLCWFEPDFVWTKCRSASSGHVFQTVLAALRDEILYSPKTLIKSTDPWWCSINKLNRVCARNRKCVNQNGKTAFKLGVGRWIIKHFN